MGTVAGVDDGHGSHLAGILRSPFEAVAHGNHVSVVRYHEDRVLQRFTFRDTRCLRIRESDDTRSQTVGSRFETQTCAGGGFVEKCCDNFSFQ